MTEQLERWIASDKAVARKRRRENASSWALYHEKLAEQIEGEATQRAAYHCEQSQGYRDMLVTGIPEPTISRDRWQ